MGLQVVVTPSRVVPGTEYRVSVSDVISRIWNALPARDSVSIVNAGETPQILAESRGTYQDSQRLSQSVVYSPNWAMDLALRLSGNLLVREDRIRHLLVVGDGELQDNSFSQFGLEEAQGYLRNNSIVLHYIHVGTSSIDPAIEYIVKQTGGKVLSYYGDYSFETFLEDLRLQYPGRYWIEYSSRFDDDFGRKYLPLEVQVQYLTKSGRDESGYFAPLRF